MNDWGSISGSEARSAADFEHTTKKAEKRQTKFAGESIYSA